MRYEPDDADENLRLQADFNNAVAAWQEARSEALRLRAAIQSALDRFAKVHPTWRTNLDASICRELALALDPELINVRSESDGG